MRSVFALAAMMVAMGAVVAVNAAEQLDAKQFKDVVESDTAADVTFVKFYAPWCGHCKRLAPTWDRLAEHYGADDDGVNVVKVDCTKERALCQANGVRGYPTLKLFKKGESESQKYAGQRDFGSLQSFVDKNLS